nr:hypothetical protein CFP56_21837 [Quercus suber]
MASTQGRDMFMSASRLHTSCPGKWLAIQQGKLYCLARFGDDGLSPTPSSGRFLTLPAAGNMIEPCDVHVLKRIGFLAPWSYQATITLVVAQRPVGSLVRAPHSHPTSCMGKGYLFDLRDHVTTNARINVYGNIFGLDLCRHFEMRWVSSMVVFLMLC